MTSISTDNARRGSTHWHHVPDLPLRPAPFLRRPFRPGVVAPYIARSWGVLTPRLTMLLVAVVVWRWFMPDADTTQRFGAGWVAQIWVRNLVIVGLAAGLTHLWLYRWRRQGDDLRYDARPFPTDKRIFLFRNQVLDNMALTLGPAVAVWTVVEALALWSFSNGWARLMTFDEHPVWFVVAIALIPLWSVLYFSVGHRLLHLGPAYRSVHSWHHKNTNVGPWSGLAMHPLEHVVLFADVFVIFLVPLHPVHLYFMMLHHGIGAPLSHTGFDAIRLPGGARFRVGDFHHQLHHRYRECNYGGLESPIDQLLGTFNDGTSSRRSGA